MTYILIEFEEECNAVMETSIVNVMVYMKYVNISWINFNLLFIYSRNEKVYVSPFVQVCM